MECEACSFSKKTEVILFSFTFLALVLGTTLIACSERFIPLMYDFFSKRVFHREFSLEAWLPTMQSFIIIPVFFALAVNIVVFHKHTERLKIIYLAVLVACVAFLITYTVLTSLHKFIDSDLAGETLLAKECIREKSFVPLGWRYSTELRLLNTQLISAPLFLLTSNWDVVRALTSLISCSVLFWAGWVLLAKLGIKKAWLKFFGSALLACPWSSLNFYVIGWGNYYIPHIVMGFVTLAIFIPILNGTSKNSKISLAFFYALSFISGASTIRYVLSYQFPLFVATMILLFKRDDDTKAVSFCELKKIFWDSKALKASLIGLFLSGIGYVFNSVILQRLYNFSQWNKEQFNFFGDVTLQDLFSAILRAFGFQEGVAAFTPSGVINVCVYIALILFAMNMVKAIKVNMPIEKRFLLIFTAFTIVFNSFLYYHLDFISRYYIVILAYMIPCVIVFIDTVELGTIKRYFVGAMFSLCIFTSSFTAPQGYLTGDPNKDLYPVMDFLNKKVQEDSDYAFGYSTRDFANVITYFTHGKIEVAATKKQERYLAQSGGVADSLPQKFTEAMGLTPSRYYKHKHKGKTFFMLSQSLYNNSIDNKVFEAGSEVFNDGHYLVFEYQSQDAFLNAFGL